MSKKFKAHVYTIRTLTNLHVGGSGSNFDIVDKQVQRDPTTDFPTIYASSLKGALREYFDGRQVGADVLNYIFGSESGQGEFRFISADILAIPRPANPFEYVKSEKVYTAFRKKVELMGNTITKDPSINWNDDSDGFQELSNELPVIARNYLINGMSENLWYEEVVPRESIFGFMVLAPDGDEYLAKFDELVDGKVIQVGANATIGYGLCEFNKIS